MKKRPVLLWAPSLALALMIILTGSGINSIWVDNAFGLSLRHKTVSDQTDVQDPVYDCSIKVPETEPKDLISLTTINADEALAAALTKYPLARVVQMELENENGCLIYSIDLSNHKEVKVDAGNGKVLHVESAAFEGKHKEHEGHENAD